MYRYVPNESVIKRYGINIPYIVMHIASTRRRWTFPIPRWEKVVRQVLDRIPDATIILTGSPADFSFVEKLASLFPKNKVRNCAGSFSASELVSVIHYAELYIGVDTGITHIAGNMSKKAIVIGHQYIPPVFLSYNPNGIVLFNKDACQCRGDATQTCNVIENGELYMRCTFYITDEMIEETLKKLLGKRK